MSSDEDEIDDASQDYLERLEEKVTKNPSQHMFGITTSIQSGDHRSDDDDDDSELEANEETALESYVTPLDSEDTNQDEYIVFKEIMQSEFSLRLDIYLIFTPIYLEHFIEQLFNFTH